jgi:plastocyanin
MRKTLLFILLLTSTISFGKKWTITSPGNTYSPATLTINFGDTVVFNIGSYHNAVEVSENTWNTNGNFQVPGISVPFGGGTVLPSALTVGTHYYVCTPHAVLGMKGIIIVQNTTDIQEREIVELTSVYPNPAKNNLHVRLSRNSDAAVFKLFDITGKVVMVREIFSQENIPVGELNRGLFLYSIDQKDKTTKGKLILE